MSRAPAAAAVAPEPCFTSLALCAANSFPRWEETTVAKVRTLVECLAASNVPTDSMAAEEKLAVGASAPPAPEADSKDSSNGAGTPSPLARMKARARGMGVADVVRPWRQKKASKRLRDLQEEEPERTFKAAKEGPVGGREAQQREGGAPLPWGVIRAGGPTPEALLSSGLPKGVQQGCDKCLFKGCLLCRKILAKWRPQEGRRPLLEEAPTFYPTPEEFEDPIAYLASIRPTAEAFGICKIVPPASWQPPSPLRKECTDSNLKLPVRIQQTHRLQVREGSAIPLKKKAPLAGGGPRRQRYASAAEDDAPAFAFEPGAPHLLSDLEAYAEEFKLLYFLRDGNGRRPVSIEEIEGEFWRIVERPTEEIEVLYAADLESSTYGRSPAAPAPAGGGRQEYYERSGWNLSNIARHPGSVLAFEKADISGVVVPWLYVGMCLSSFCWHVEDHWFYSVNYLHWGSPKVWYGVPGHAAPQMEAVMRKRLPHLFNQQPNLLQDLVTQLSPAVLKAEGLPVFRLEQNAREFVVTFPRAYHSGFNTGFNCAEAVNVAPCDWLPHGQRAVEFYRENLREPSLSHDKLLFSAARRAVAAFGSCKEEEGGGGGGGGGAPPGDATWREMCGPGKLLAANMRVRVEVETACYIRAAQEFYASPQRMHVGFDLEKEQECATCHYDLHLSAVTCTRCSPGRYVCLEHIADACRCRSLPCIPRSVAKGRILLHRFTPWEMNALLGALEGKPQDRATWRDVEARRQAEAVEYVAAARRAAAPPPLDRPSPALSSPAASILSTISVSASQLSLRLPPVLGPNSALLLKQTSAAMTAVSVSLQQQPRSPGGGLRQVTACMPPESGSCSMAASNAAAAAIASAAATAAVDFIDLGESDEEEEEESSSSLPESPSAPGRGAFRSAEAVLSAMGGSVRPPAGHLLPGSGAPTPVQREGLDVLPEGGSFAKVLGASVEKLEGVHLPDTAGGVPILSSSFSGLAGSAVTLPSPGVLALPAAKPPSPERPLAEVPECGTGGAASDSVRQPPHQAASAPASCTGEAPHGSGSRPFDHDSPRADLPPLAPPPKGAIVCNASSKKTALVIKQGGFRIGQIHRISPRAPIPPDLSSGGGCASPNLTGPGLRGGATCQPPPAALDLRAADDGRSGGGPPSAQQPPRRASPGLDPSGEAGDPSSVMKIFPLCSTGQLQALQRSLSSAESRFKVMTALAEELRSRGQ